MTTQEIWAYLHRHPTGSMDVLWEARRNLPCRACVEHFDQYIRQNPPSFGDGWFAWTVLFHNNVNYRIGKPILMMSQAKALWGR